MDNRVAIIGAGYAGLVAAVELAAAGRRVELFEASRTLGGRARRIDAEGTVLDNGAHILVGAYRETLRLMRTVGIDSDRVLRRHPLHLEYPGEMRIAAPSWLPAPLHMAWALLAARGLPLTDKLAAVRFMRAMEAQRFRLPEDTTASALFAAHGQGERLRRYLWEPLCVAALNTEAERGSAQVFLNVLRDSLAADRAASDLLLPATDFSELLPEPAAAWLAANGSTVHRSCRIEGLQRTDAGWMLASADETHGPYANVILAVAPYHLGKLIDGLPLAALVETLQAFEWEPIVTAYLAYPPEVRLPFAMVGVAGGHAQWLFDRGALCGQPGLIAAVISAHGRHEELDHDELCSRIAAETERAVGRPLPPPHWQRVIVEKRATFACTPGLRRPACATGLPGLHLAGDYVAGEYPATIEGAVRSGATAARAVLER